MSTPALRVDNVSKMYRLGEVGTGSLSHDLNRAWARLRGRPDPYALIGAVNDRTSEGTRDFVWALRDINFEVGQGDIVGIIGRNGAGKSTLLKLLSRVTAPTEGKIFINGRIASLLEVGTGFHPDLTGRENIFLNGAILGMNKQEIRARFDEIVEFSGCAKYIDTPVKRYSSGMHVRLAFAVAAHLETDILIVDEVLAVGDAEFQQRCLGKMKDLSTKGHRTVLFVSHNMASISALCPRSLMITKGGISFDGVTSETIRRYMKESQVLMTSRVSDRSDRSGNGKARLVKIQIKDSQSEIRSQFATGEQFRIEMEIECSAPLENCNIALGVYNGVGTKLTDFWTDLTLPRLNLHRGINHVSCVSTSSNFSVGDFRFNFFLESNNEVVDAMEDVAQAEFMAARTGNLQIAPRDDCGPVLLDHEWTFNGGMSK